MCGIVGIINGKSSLVESMLSTLSHRGPDGSQVFIKDNIALGHARLSIIDLNSRSSQPFRYTSLSGNSYTIVFNGEIYNYIEIKDTLIKKGYLFNTTSDTEVIAAAYSEWGDDCVSKFNGMWAFCIYDIKNSKLFCSRDRLGVKPFYYYYSNNELIFSSEIKGILQHKHLEINAINNISVDAVDLYFSLGYIPSPLSIYKNVYKLQAGHNLVFDLEKSEIVKLYKYYNLPSVSYSTNKFDLIEEGRYLIRDAVKLRMRSDVPVGAFLSGGLDSSTVVGEMRHFTNANKLHTFSIGFSEKAYDESKYAYLVKDYFATLHHHHIYTEDEFNALWSSYSEIFDEPFGDYSSFPSYQVCKLAKENVTVVLSGDGGDEIFGGYPIYSRGNLAEMISNMPEVGRNILYKITAKAAKYDRRFEKVAELIRLSLLAKSSFYSQMFSDSRYKPQVYIDYTTQCLNHSLQISSNSLPEALRINDLLYNTLADNYLVKVDRTSMNNSIEVRSPFLDYRLAEYAQKIPVYQKVGNFSNKILMREIIKDIVPQEILKRDKMGFTPPINQWLYKSVSNEQFLRYSELLHQFSPQLYQFYKNLLNNKVDSHMRDFYMIKLVIFGKWINKWVLS